MMSPEINNQIVVITGASSGIGRATALRLARDGATIVALARNEDALQSVVRECEESGGRAMALPVDVTVENDVRDAARLAIEAFGHIDVWINDAAVGAFGRFEEIPPDDYWRVIQTNLFGYVNGMRAVLPHFRERGRGIIINISSVVGKIGQPFMSAYATSKAAIIGLSESVRMEQLDAPDIHICTIMPSTVDTPFYQHAANFFGRAPKAMTPVFTPEEIAEIILKTIKSPRPEVTIGTLSKTASMLRQFAPGIAERLFAKKVEAENFQDEPAAETRGNLFSPMRDITGIHGGGSQPRSRTGIASAAAAGVAAIGAGTWFLLRRRK